MSATVVQPADSPLDQIVREDVYGALIDQGFKRDQAENAARCATGVTFSELFKSALEWANNARRGFRVVTKSKESPMAATPAVSTPKANGRAPAAEKHCAGFERECGQVLGALNRTGLCSTCYARKNYTEKYSATARGNAAPKPKALKVPKAPAPVLSAAPPVAARVSLEVTEAQLNQFLVKLSLEDKQRLANYFLQSAEG